MKKQLIMASAFMAFAFASCNDEANDVSPSGIGTKSLSAADYSASSLPKQVVSGSITSNTTFTNDRVWVLNGIIKVKSGATLTIQPGTFIVGKVSTSDHPGTLVITKSAKINAVGTATQPIVFTSYNMVDGNAATVGAPGDFGGVIVLGNAPANTSGALIEGLIDETYGGNMPSDDSGTLQYIRIEYPGHILDPNTANEINGLTLGGVGNGTTINHVQVSYSKDDSFEFFGGTVNATHLVSLAADDDNFDFDNGYSGRIQFAVSVADRNSTHSTSGGSSDSNGIESDNDASGSSATPFTKPVISNLTIVGTSSADAGYKYGNRWRRNTSLVLANSIIMGYPTGVMFDGTPVQDKFASGESKFINNLVHGFTSAANVQLGTNNFYHTNANANYFIKLAQPFYNAGALNLAPANSTSPAYTGASFTDPALAGMQQVSYRGAVGPTNNWLSGWTNFLN